MDLGSRAREPGLDRAALVRHFALLAATIVVYGFELPLASGGAVLWIIAGAAAVNLAGSLLRWTGRHRRVLEAAGPFVSLLVWTALAYLSGGARSPVIAGFWVELILSARARAPVGPVPVALASAGLLWLQQSLLGFGETLPVTLLETGFLAFMGFVTWYLKRSWKRDRVVEERTRSELERKLEKLESDLDDARTLRRVGEGTARLAHGLKNAVHSFRGFVGLMEEFEESSVRSRALAGLRMAIDELDALARTTLRPGEDRTSPGEVGEVIESAVRGVSQPSTRLDCSREVTPPPFPLGVSPGALKEILIVLLRNAIEAATARPWVELRTSANHGSYLIQVRDHGPGLAGADPDRLFQPEYTTKPQGSGFGLHLARNLLESAGGTLTASPAPGAGAVFTARIPMVGGGP